MSFPMLGQDTSVGEQGQGSPDSGASIPQGINPSWGEMLKTIPPELHNQVVPHLQKYDQNTNKVHSRYEPYKEFVDNGVGADQLRQAIGIMRALESNPQGVYDVLHQQFGQAVQQQANPSGQGLPGNDGEDPFEGLPPIVREKMSAIDQLQQGFNTVAEYLMAQGQRSEEEQQDAELEAFYSGLAQRNSTFAALNQNGEAEPYINALLAAGVSEKDAEESFMKFIESVGMHQARPKPPALLGSGGGGMLPSNGVKPGQMSPHQVKDFVAQTLMAAKNANQ